MPLTQVSKTAPLARPAFDAALRAWLASAPEPEVGGAGDGRTPWVWVRSDAGDLCHLNSNTTRQGVAGYLALADAKPPEWVVVRNAQGVENKVAFGPERRVVPGFYLYRPTDATAQRGAPDDGSVGASILLPVGSTVVAAILALEALGFAVRVDPTDNELGCAATRGGVTFRGPDPVRVLGLVKLAEVRGDRWGATDAEIEATLARFPL